MDRRESLKSLFVSSIAGGLVFQSCDPKPEDGVELKTNSNYYGRTPEEALRDQQLAAEEFFTTHELDTISVLCDIILPAFEDKGPASEADVAQFVEFMAKDLPAHQTPIRGGLMWLDGHAKRSFSLNFIDCSPDQQIAIVDQIAYPDRVSPGMEPGASFFSLMRNLTLTGYYTTAMGIEDLGYKGNNPNVWDGVPDEVLKEHGLEYPPEWLPKFVNQDNRNIQAEWDEEGNLLT